MRRLALALAVLLLAGPAGAEGFRPFVFTDPALAERFAGSLDDLRLARPVDAPLTSRSLDKIRLTVFTPVAQVWASVDRPPPPEDPACPVHSRARPPAGACPWLAEGWRRARDAGRAACRAYWRPESFAERWPAGRIDPPALKDFTGLIAMMLAPLKAVGAGALVPETHRPVLRRALAKIRARAIAADLTAATGRWRDLAADAARLPDCGPAPDITPFLAELAAARQALTRLVAAGRRQAAADRAALAPGRQRPELPFAAVTDAERRLLAFYLGAVTWRMRGGGLVDDPPDTATTRLWYTAIPMAQIAFLTGGHQAIPAGLGIWDRVSRGWARWMAMGHSPHGTDRWHDLVHMTRRGAYQTGATRDWLAARGYDPTAAQAGGLMMGACYLWPWERLSDHRLAGYAGPPLAPFIDGPTAWGELCAGGTLALGLADSLLAGHGDRTGRYFRIDPPRGAW